MKNKEVIIRGTGVKKIYKMGEVEIPALAGVSFEIYDGEFVVILGPSGSGKSTLLNIIGGMDDVTEGTIEYRGEVIDTQNKQALTNYRRSAVGFVFQFYNLIPNLTTVENVELAREIAQSSLDATEMLRLVNLEDRKNHFPAQLSGGQQQRVSIARALAKDPALLLCDEPTGALDSASGREVLKTLRRFCDEYQTTVVVITHNHLIAPMADRVMRLRDGLIERIEINEAPVDIERIEF